MSGLPYKPDLMKNDFPCIIKPARLPLEQLLWLHSVPYELGTSRYSIRDPMETLPRENVPLQTVSTNGMRRVRLSERVHGMMTAVIETLCKSNAK